MVKPRVIAFELTRKCRFNCIHCRASAGNSARQELSTDQCRSILKAIADYNKSMIILTGGEPLEREDIFELAQYCRDMGLGTAFATCGYLINEDVVRRLQQCGVGAFSLSLDGATAGTHDSIRQTEGAFEAVVNAARVFQHCGAKFQINTTITKGNANEIAQIAKLASSLGAACFNAFILVPAGRGLEIGGQLLESDEYERVLKELLRLKASQEMDVRVTCGPQFARLSVQEGQSKPGEIKGCLGGREFGFVSYKGDVQICGFCNISAGNLVDNNFDFRKIWEYSQFLQDVRNHKAYKGNCGICEFAVLCRGCRARALGVAGDYLQSDPICNYKPRRSGCQS